MKFRSLAGALALCAALPAMAAPVCTQTFSLGTLGVNDAAGQWRAFYSPQAFSDCFLFTLSQLSDTSVISADVDLSFRLNIDFASLSLSGGNLVGEQSVTPGDYNGHTFSGLQSGNYVLAASGNVSGSGTDQFPFGVGYGVGVITTSPQVTPVPEPETMAMLALGLAVVTWGTRRKA
jgi:hypothetical protein